MTTEREAEQPLIITIEGADWDLDRIDAFIKQLLPAYDCPNVVLDMSHVRYIDSSILAAFVRKRKVRAEKGWRPSRLVLSPQVRKIFQVVRFDAIWPIFDSLEGALAAT